MLGSLARWLRVLGLDVVYDPRLDDAALVDRAVEEQRVILTRDRRLVQRRLARHHVLIRSEAVAEQLRQVLTDLQIDPSAIASFGRCLRCNTPLVDLDAAAALGRIPPYVALTQEQFRGCPDCGRTFWRATHTERMRRRLAEMGISLPPA
jgi:hypothetical protein